MQVELCETEDQAKRSSPKRPLFLNFRGGRLRKLRLYKIIVNEQAERRRSACEAATLMPREVLQ